MPGPSAILILLAIIAFIAGACVVHQGKGLASAVGTAVTEGATGAFSPLQEGKAVYYSSVYHGRKTASGEVYDENALTAAHRTLGFGTLVRVTNQKNGKSVVVRINDRGPFGKKKERIIDLSLAAAREIDMVKAGVVPVLLEVKKK
jgi:rare lipoprotein A